MVEKFPSKSYSYIPTYKYHKLMLSNDKWNRQICVVKKRITKCVGFRKINSKK